MPTSGFSRNIWFLSQFPGVTNARFAPLFDIGFHKQRPAHLMKRRNLFD